MMKEKRGEVEHFCSWTQVSGSPSHTFPPPRLCGRLGFPCIQTRTLHGRDGRQPPPHSVALCITWDAQESGNEEEETNQSGAMRATKEDERTKPAGGSFRSDPPIPTASD
ncbi:hypothetical protein FQA47_018057 [Oryzias melastigma]|uniref:Uncharacterized protein n=1 Tax=Oryzias melastigma TaxID=30732 RepID=A0A834C306_ORYME|nr:hypothetical protein FQA47_018057 [Oryzias melastigma]